VETNITEYPLLHRGKVRDIYEIGPDQLLLVTTDRISAFDVILPTPIPDKGKILNQITLFWMEKFADVMENHVIAWKVDDYPEPLKAHRAELSGRSVLVKRARPLPIECIVRGYITGSGWKDYQKTGKVSGHVLPSGLRESDKLEEPLFTPSTKADLGEHDENITVEEAMSLAGKDVAEQAGRAALEIYSRGREFARERGIIIADTKFKLLLIDEVLTPDSSRFWPEDGYAPGKGQPSFDKQFVRDWLEEIGFDKKPPAPEIPDNIRDKTREKYLEAFTRLTGRQLED
jgi:phosphoribosylaminoimidazole-succinocarboxamide synthase